MYVNAKFVHSVAGSGTLSQDWSKAAVIGDETGVMELNGIVDEFYMYTKALSHPEIVNLAQACAYGELLHNDFNFSFLSVLML